MWRRARLWRRIWRRFCRGCVIPHFFLIALLAKSGQGGGPHYSRTRRSLNLCIRTGARADSALDFQPLTGPNNRDERQPFHDPTLIAREECHKLYLSRCFETQCRRGDSWGPVVGRERKLYPGQSSRGCISPTAQLRSM